MQALQKQLDYAFSLVSKPDNKSIKEGEGFLDKLRKIREYPILLLTYLKESIAFQGKLRASIQLRIWCDYYKNLEQFERNSYQNIIEDIKTNLLFAFLTYPDKIEKTLLPAIVSLTAVQFPDNWRSLIPDLISYVTQNSDSALKMLQLMSQITNKYSYLSRSDPLYHQIIIVCNQFQNFLINITKYTVQNILTNQNNPDQLKILQQQMILFYNLNYQDLHPAFQDNLPQWMTILNKVMNLPNNNDKFFKCKGAALQSILLYASKYKEDVQDSIKGFMQQIWSLCANASSNSEYDDIVTNALKYFKSLLLWQDMKPSFASNIDNLISNLILPNLNLTTQYKEMFQQDIQTFISYFFRNSETLTRRSNAIELLQSIVRHFNQNFQPFLDNQVRGFVPTPDNVNMQCLLLTLVIQSAPRGFRDVDGVTGLQINPNIITYCYQHLIKQTLNSIYQKCQSDPNRPIQKQINFIQLLTTLRFIFYFRIYLPTGQLDLILRLCCGMYCQNQSLKQIIILVVSAVVTIKHGDFARYTNIVWYYDQNKLKVVAGQVFGMIAMYQKGFDQLNTGLNKLLFSVIKQLKAQNQQFYTTYTGPIIKQMLRKTSTFTFTSVLPLFQAIGYLAYYLSSMKSRNCQQLQNMIQQYFHQMIKLQSDMLNFCFQILSIFLRFNPGNLTFYNNIYNSIIRIQNWTQQNISLISSYLQYIAAYISLNNQKIIDDKQSYQQILTKLIQIDHYQLFYRLLRWILKLTDIQGFFKYGYMHILVKGTQFIATKSIEGRKMGLLFLFQITYDYNTDIVIKCLNTISNGFYENTLLKSQDIIKTMQVLRNRKIMFGSICYALAVRAFSTVRNQALMLSLLIENTSGRYRRDNFIGVHNENIAKKQSTYQKLIVFKEIDLSDKPVNLDEEMVLLQAYNVCINNSPDLNNYIDQANLVRIKKIYDKNQNKNL